jgi:hypothetical protein
MFARIIACILMGVKGQFAGNDLAFKSGFDLNVDLDAGRARDVVVYLNAADKLELAL